MNSWVSWFGWCCLLAAHFLWSKVIRLSSSLTLGSAALGPGLLLNFPVPLVPGSFKSAGAFVSHRTEEGSLIQLPSLILLMNK
jgi:hypothetical protein